MIDENQCCERAYGARAFQFGHTPGTPRLCCHHMCDVRMASFLYDAAPLASHGGESA